MLTDAQRTLLEDKFILWDRKSREGNMELRDYNRRAADALKVALSICSAYDPTVRPSTEVSREEVSVTDEMVKRASIAFDEYVSTIPPNDEVDTEPCVRAALTAALLSWGEG